MLKENKKLSLIGRSIVGVVVCLFTLISGLIVGLIRWVFETWSNLSASELLYQLQAPVEGTNKEMILDAVLTCLPWIVGFLVAGILLFVWCRKQKAWIFRTMMCFGLLMSVTIAVSMLRYAWQRLDLTDYINSQNLETGFIDGNYADPEEVVLVFPEEKRNLIYIFLESMEVTYADEENGGAFEINYIPELTELAQTYEDFSGSELSLNGGYDMPFTTWTIAAMFAHTSGLPLKLPMDGNSMTTQDDFLPEVISLGDILEKEGYNQTLIVGSDATFGGRRMYFSEHGNFNIVDLPYNIEIGRLPEGYSEWWGYRDELLFEYAKEEVLTLAAQDEPFNLTMLTVDTHFEDGYACGLCGTEYGENTGGDGQYANVMACSSCQVNAFVEWLEQQTFYENTTIVLVGDHHTMDNTFCLDIDEEYVRKVYTAYINAAVTPEDPMMRREYTTFDYFPTTLASLGVTIEGNRLGLGTNLFSTEPTLLEIYGMEEMKTGINSKSEVMDYLTRNVDASKAMTETDKETE